MLSQTPIERYTFEGHTFFLKRDDLLHPDFSGNKARKFYYFLRNEFPLIKTIISYGSSQSNAMYSLSVLAKMRSWKFEYYIDHLSDYLLENPQGNYKAALQNGMKVYESPYPIHRKQESEVLWIEEGGRQSEAQLGVSLLADEILVWQKEHELAYLNIFLPSGTGTTALFLQKALIQECQEVKTKVYTTPCVGDTEYLKSQFLALEQNEKYHPHILSLEKKYHFGKLYKDNYEIWLKLQKQTGLAFDLLYDPLGWRTLLAYPKVFDVPVLYIHQGGLLGNESMLPRYERKWKKDENIL